MILIVSIWNSFSIPVDIAFEPPIFNELPNVVANHIIDIVFAIDILIHFRTTIVNEITGDEIKEARQISMTYLKGRFIIDILATVPFDTIFLGLLGSKISGQLSILSLLKLFRVLRLFKIISFMNASESVKHSLKISKLLFYLVLYIHCQACAWFYFTSIDKTWFPLEKLLLGQTHFYDDHHVTVLY
jgi:hypothetical protein